jgi:hypothetical protein
MSCKGICIRHKASKPSAAVLGRYTMGQKRCSTCDIFVKWEGVQCVCCGHMLRTRPHSSKYRMKLRKITEVSISNKL